ncbi:MAG: hypothetical protein V3V08_09245, partial [Nannocystaceae bacterium]
MISRFCTALLCSALLFAPACGKDEPKEESAKAGPDAGERKVRRQTDRSKFAETAVEEKSKETANEATTGDSLKWLKYLPSDAEALAQVSIKSLVKSKLWAALRETGDAKKMVEALKQCNLEIESFDSLTLGKGPQERAAVVIVGEGVGKADTLQCVHAQLKENTAGESKWSVEVKGGETVIVRDDGEVRGHVVADNTLVLASKDWDKEVANLIKGTGESVMAGGLAKVIRRADTGRTTWFAAEIPEEMREQLPPQLAQLVDVAGAIDLSKGVTFALTGRVSTPGQAESAKAQLVTLYEQYKPLAPMFGVPEAIVNKLVFGTQQDAVSISLSLTEEELRRLTEQGQAMLAESGVASATTDAGAAPGVPAGPVGAAAGQGGGKSGGSKSGG